MPVVNAELNVKKEYLDQPIIWRLGKMFNVVTNIQRARITDDFAFVSLAIEGSTQETEQAVNYLDICGFTVGSTYTTPQHIKRPEDDVPKNSAITVEVSTDNPQQAVIPALYRVGRDFGVVVTITRAAFDTEDGGSIEFTISGVLEQIQRAIAWLHTTGLHINPYQRSVTNQSNL